MPLVKCFGGCGKTQDDGKRGDQGPTIPFGFWCGPCHKAYLHYLGPTAEEVASAHHDRRNFDTTGHLRGLGKEPRVPEGLTIGNIYSCKDDFVHDDEVDRQQRRNQQEAKAILQGGERDVS